MSKYRYTSEITGGRLGLINYIIVNHNQGVVSLQAIEAKLRQIYKSQGAGSLGSLSIIRRRVVALGYYMDGDKVYRYPANGMVCKARRLRVRACGPDRPGEG